MTDATEKIELATATKAVEADVKVEAKAKPTPAPKAATVPTLTLTAPKTAKKLEPHFKSYGATRGLTVVVKDDDTLVLTGADARAEATIVYAKRYEAVTLVQ